MAKCPSETAESASQPGAARTRYLHCTRCGYDLRGLAPERMCPECGTPIKRSIHGNLLSYADPAWVDRLHFGTVVMLWNLLAGMMSGAAVVIAVNLGMPPVVSSVAHWVASGLGLWATFLLTAPEPATVLAEGPVTLRKLVRALAIVSILGQVLCETPSAWVLGSELQIAGNIMQFAWLGATVGLLVYLRRLALRVPDERLARATTIVTWGLAITLGWTTAMGLVVAATMGGAAGGTAGSAKPPTAAYSGVFFSPLVGCIAFLFIAAFGILYLLLLFRYHRAFKVAAAEAGRTLAEGLASEDGKPREL